MKQLWAPWRMEFLSGEKKTEGTCVFCTLPKAGDDRESLIVHRGEMNYIIMNKFPYNNGHLMVVPFQHTADLEQLSDEATNEMFRLGKLAVSSLRDKYKPEGYNLGMNLGAAGGAGIRDHVHLHIVPRWLGDTNFMPVIGETKAMPQHLMTSYDTIQEFFSRVK